MEREVIAKLVRYMDPIALCVIKKFYDKIKYVAFHEYDEKSCGISFVVSNKRAHVLYTNGREYSVNLSGHRYLGACRWVFHFTGKIDPELVRRIHHYSGAEIIIGGPDGGSWCYQ